MQVLAWHRAAAVALIKITDTLPCTGESARVNCARARAFRLFRSWVVFAVPAAGPAVTVGPRARGGAARLAVESRLLQRLLFFPLSSKLRTSRVPTAKRKENDSLFTFKTMSGDSVGSSVTRSARGSARAPLMIDWSIVPRDRFGSECGRPISQFILTRHVRCSCGRQCGHEERARGTTSEARRHMLRRSRRCWHLAAAANCSGRQRVPDNAVADPHDLEAALRDLWR